MQRRLFQPRKRGIGISKNPVNSVFVLIEHHFDIGERNRQRIEAAVLCVQLIIGHRRRFAVQRTDQPRTFFGQCGGQLLFAAGNIAEPFAVVEVYFVRNVVYRHHRYQPAAVHLEERVAQCAFQSLQRDQTLVDLTAGGVYLRHVFVHLNIQNRADINRKLLSIADNGEKICFLQARRHPFCCR